MFRTSVNFAQLNAKKPTPNIPAESKTVSATVKNTPVLKYAAPTLQDKDSDSVKKSFRQYSAIKKSSDTDALHQLDRSLDYQKEFEKQIDLIVSHSERLIKAQERKNRQLLEKWKEQKPESLNAEIDKEPFLKKKNEELKQLVMSFELKLTVVANTVKAIIALGKIEGKSKDLVVSVQKTSSICQEIFDGIKKEIKSKNRTSLQKVIPENAAKALASNTAISSTVEAVKSVEQPIKEKTASLEQIVQEKRHRRATMSWNQPAPKELTLQLAQAEQSAQAQPLSVTVPLKRGSSAEKILIQQNESPKTLAKTTKNPFKIDTTEQSDIQSQFDALSSIFTDFDQIDQYLDEELTAPQEYKAEFDSKYDLRDQPAPQLEQRMVEVEMVPLNQLNWTSILSTLDELHDFMDVDVTKSVLDIQTWTDSGITKSMQMLDLPAAETLVETDISTQLEPILVQEPTVEAEQVTSVKSRDPSDTQPQSMNGVAKVTSVATNATEITVSAASIPTITESQHIFSKSMSTGNLMIEAEIKQKSATNSVNDLKKGSNNLLNSKMSLSANSLERKWSIKSVTNWFSGKKKPGVDANLVLSEIPRSYLNFAIPVKADSINEESLDVLYDFIQEQNLQETSAFIEDSGLKVSEVEKMIQKQRKIKHKKQAKHRESVQSSANSLYKEYDNIPIFGGTIEDLVYSDAHSQYLTVSQVQNVKIPSILLKCISFIKKNGIESVGIFRLTGGLSRVKELEAMISSSGNSKGFDFPVQITENDVATLLKMFLRQLQEPLVPEKLTILFQKSAEIQDKAARTRLYQSLISFIPRTNLSTLYLLLEFLSVVASHSERNSMNSSNLGVVFAPNIFKTDESEKERSAVKKHFSLVDCVKFMIENYEAIFQLPQSLLAIQQ